MENVPQNGDAAKVRQLVVRLPWLREMPACFDSLKMELPGLCRLWPGLGEIPAGNWHEPANYPLKPDIAQKYLADLEALDADALACARNLGLVTENAKTAGNLAEMADLAAFASGGDTHESGIGDEIALVQAHKTLIWIWLAQGRAAEIASLAESFGQKAARFSDILAEGEENPAPAPVGEIGLDEKIMPSWQAVFLNAMRFLPQDAAIFAEGPMRSALLERETFEPAPEFGNGIGKALLPLWRVAGSRRLAPLFQRSALVYTYLA